MIKRSIFYSLMFNIVQLKNDLTCKFFQLNEVTNAFINWPSCFEVYFCEIIILINFGTKGSKSLRAPNEISP